MYLKTEFLRLILRWTKQTCLYFILLLLGQAPSTCQVGVLVFCMLRMFVPVKWTSFYPAMTRADSCQPLTTEDRMQFQANSCRIDGGQKGTRTTSLRISLLICHMFPSMILTRSSVCFFHFGATAPQWAGVSSFTRLLGHTQRRTTVGRTPLDEWSACRRDLYLTTHITHNRHTSMPPVGFEPTISAGERPKTLGCAATGTDRPYVTGAI
jgi:hypothetical protein